MIKFFTERLNREDRGFTLIELMVVVLIIAILIAIAIPTFLGARRRAQDRAAQSSLRNAVTAAKTIFTDNESYEDALVEDDSTPPVMAVQGVEPSLEFRGADDDVGIEQTVVSVDAPDRNTFIAAAYSRSGVCWFVRDVAGPAGVDPAVAGTMWNRTDGIDDGVDCNATAGGELTEGWARNTANAGEGDPPDPG